MALSQQHEGLMLVPWFNKEEWDLVYNLLFEKEDLKAAQSIMKVWKQRTPKLPSAVECTLIIINTYLFDKSLCDDSTKLMYSASLMRFLNLCCSHVDKQGTFTQKAKRYNFPEWIVNMRHDIAHSDSVPSMELLTCAIKFCYNWVYEAYWEPQREMLESYSPNRKVSMVTTGNVKCALKSYCRIVSLHYLKNCEKTPHEIKRLDSKLRPIVAEYHLDHLESISIVVNRLLGYLTNEIGEVRDSEMKELIVDTIVSDGGIFSVYTRDAAYFDVGVSDKLPKNFVNSWSNLLDFLCDFGCLHMLLERFLCIVNNEIVQGPMRKICGLWMSYLFQRLLLTKLNQQSDVKEHTKRSIFRKFSEMKNLPPFLYNSEIESIFGTVRTLKSIADTNPNSYTLLFIDSLLALCDASTQEAKYVEVIQILAESGESLTDLNDMENDILYLDNDVASPASVEEIQTQYRFVPVKDFSIFENCPLGILRHQNTNVNPWFTTADYR